MSVDDDGDEDLRKLNHRLRDENMRVKDDVGSEETNLVEDVDLKVNGVSENVRDGHGGALQAPVVLQVPQQLQQQSQGAVVCWERFLHLRSLKVLLVENDDSTRHVVSALLRNCSYEVIEAANGIQAWKILEDLTRHIDLVLTEVVMPCLSGIGLLCKIMSHKTCKNVPVIMMSSHDATGLVFKCLSKGAVDFLVKPIRKNELKNLWQHVWRRCHSSSGSGSESGTQTQNSIKSTSVEKSDNNSASNDEDDNGSNGLNVGDESDNGSGTQSSWTKQAVEIDSPRVVRPWEQVAECPDSICAQVIHSNAEISSNNRVPLATAKECQEQEEQFDNIEIGKDLEMGELRSLDLQLEYPAADPINILGANQDNLLEGGSSKYNEKIDEVKLNLNSESPSSKLKYDAVNLPGVTANTTGPRMDSRESEALSGHSKISDIENKAISDAQEIYSFEFSLKRLRGVEDVEKTVQDNRNVLRRSDSSAFSRYNTASNANKASAGNIISGSPCDSGLDVTKKESVCDLQCHSICHPYQCSFVGSNNIEMGSTTNNSSPKSAVLKNKSTVTSMIKCLHPPATFPKNKGDLSCASEQVLSGKAGDVACRTMLAQPWGTHQELQDQHLTHHCDHHHHHLQNVHQHGMQQLAPNHDDFSLTKMAATVPHCGSSNAFGGAIEGNTGNCSINGSASGSNHGSNGKNRSSTAVNAGGTNVESDNGIGGKSGSGDASGSGSRSRVEPNKFAQREAALTKFRQKREERCFRKKVRYQSRKRLAEQRPRLRGQFVRHSTSENTSRATDE